MGKFWGENYLSKFLLILSVFNGLRGCDFDYGFLGR